MTWIFKSKMIREKLFKWIMSYIAVLCLLGTVVTYSKYISSFKAESSEGRAASFNIAITPENNSCIQKEIDIKDNDGNTIRTDKVDSCSYNSRPTKELEYVFNVDYTGLEVSTDVIIRMGFSSDIANYENIKLYEVVGSDEILLFDYDPGTTIDIEGYRIIRGAGSILVYDAFNVNSNTQRKYKTFKIKMNARTQVGNTNTDGNFVYNNQSDFKQLILIGYTATQRR